MRANPLLGPLEGVAGWALKMETFLGPEITMSETHVHKISNVPVFIWPLKLIILMRTNPFQGLLEAVGPNGIPFARYFRAPKK
jgi:hypothetical protein